MGADGAADAAGACGAGAAGAGRGLGRSAAGAGAGAPAAGAGDAPGWLADTLVWGPGPRAAQALMLLTRARAVLQGRFAPTLDDVAAMAAPVLRHRMALSFAARARGDGIDAVIARLMDARLGAAA